MENGCDWKGRIIKPVITDSAVYVPFAFETLTIDNTSGGIALTLGTYEGASYAKISVETAPIRFRTDGGAPTVSLGHLLSIDDIAELESPNEIANFLAIRTENTSATLMVTYFK
jgi:hypothetical protein